MSSVVYVAIASIAKPLTRVASRWGFLHYEDEAILGRRRQKTGAVLWHHLGHDEEAIISDVWASVLSVWEARQDDVPSSLSNGLRRDSDHNECSTPVRIVSYSGAQPAENLCAVGLDTMAKWRAIYGSITTDEAIIELSDPDQLLYERMVVKADDWGIITGNIKALKIETIPVSSRNFQEIDDALRQMEELALIWRYQPEGRGPLIQIRKFDEHQPGELIRKRTDPKLPFHPNWRPIEGDERGSRIFQEMAGFSEKFLPRVEESRIEKSRVEENRGGEEIDPDLFVNIWEHVTGQVINSRYFGEQLSELQQKYKPDFFRAACQEGVKTSNGPMSLKYVVSICDGCLRDGRKPGEGKRGKTSRSDLSPERIAQREDFEQAVAEQQREREAKYARDEGADGPGRGVGIQDS